MDPLQSDPIVTQAQNRATTGAQDRQNCQLSTRDITVQMFFSLCGHAVEVFADVDLNCCVCVHVLSSNTSTE